MPEAIETNGSVGSTPLIRRVVDDVRHLIEGSGTLVGGRLPAERALAEQLHVSRATIRKALQELALSGVITPSSQSGWYVSSTPLSAPPQRLISFTEMAARRGQAVETRLLSARVRTATFEEDEFFPGPPDTSVLELTRLRILAGAPACLDRSVIAVWRVPSLTQADWDNTSLYRELAARGLVPSRSDFVVTAALANDLNEVLSIDAGDPVCEIEERCFDQFGGAILIGHAVYPAWAYRFRSTLTVKPR